MEQQTASKLGKEYVKTVYCHPAYLTYIQSTSCMQNVGLDEAQAGIMNAWRNISNLRYADDTTLMAESIRELKSLIWSQHFMANRWGNNGNSDRLYFLGLQSYYRW